MAAQNNNFDLLRFIGAALVLFGHSFVFLGRPEPLAFGWLPYGPLGVYMFFTISGFLIVKSWNYDPCWYRFLARRALRIFPALAVCILLTLFVLGPALTTVSLTDYFRNPATYLYLLNVILLPIYSLPGVFADNTFPNAVNGSLWSLPLEFALYLSVAGVGLLIGRWRPLARMAGRFSPDPARAAVGLEAREHLGKLCQRGSSVDHLWGIFLRRCSHVSAWSG